MSSMAGTTRDAVDTDVQLRDGRRFKLVDTAGVRKRTAVASSKDGAEVRPACGGWRAGGAGWRAPRRRPRRAAPRRGGPVCSGPRAQPPAARSERAARAPRGAPPPAPRPRTRLSRPAPAQLHPPNCPACAAALCGARVPRGAPLRGGGAGAGRGRGRDGAGLPPGGIHREWLLGRGRRCEGSSQEPAAAAAPRRTPSCGSGLPSAGAPTPAGRPRTRVLRARAQAAEGRACVIAVNKWDTVAVKTDKTLADYEADVRAQARAGCCRRPRRSRGRAAGAPAVPGPRGGGRWPRLPTRPAAVAAAAPRRAPPLSPSLAPAAQNSPALFVVRRRPSTHRSCAPSSGPTSSSSPPRPGSA